MSVLLLFSIWRFAGFVVIMFAQRLIPYAGFFPYGELLPEFHLPPFLSALANFDGIHYLLIAKNGYSQYEQAFFPLFPLLTRLSSFVFGGNQMVASLVLSHLCFLCGLSFFYSYVKRLTNNRAVALWTGIFVVSFPFSFFAGAVYTEGLFFFLTAGFFWALQNKKYGLAGVFAAFASSCRLVGVFLVFSLAYTLFFSKNKIPILKKLILSLLPFIGLLLYMVYLSTTTGDPLFFIHAQPAFGAHRSSSIILLPQVIFRYVKIFITAAPNYQYFLSGAEFLFFSLTGMALVLDAYRNRKSHSRTSLSVFSLFNLILPTLTGTFSSIPRYAFMSLSLFVFLAERNTWVRYGVFIIFLLLHAVFLALFIRGYFVG